MNTHSSKLISEPTQKLSPTISNTNKNGAGHKGQSHRPFTSISMNEIKCELSCIIMKAKSVAWSWCTEGPLGPKQCSPQ